ncbi:MAG: glycosyltransferase [Chloroflexota bacterium]|nr:glycosyltransferase [Chloroflexota bacterium]
MNVGGPSHYVSLLGGLLDPSRYESLIVAGRVGPGEASADGLAVSYGARLQTLADLGPEVSWSADLKAARKLGAMLRRFRPDIVHTHTAKAGFIGRLAACMLTPRPIIVHTYHGHVLEGYFGHRKSQAYRRLEQAAGRVSDALVGVSQSTVDDLLRLRIAPASRFRTISLGVDLGPFLGVDASDGAAVRRELRMTSDEILVTLAARLVAIKRIDVALRAVALALPRDPRLRLLILGDGELRHDLESLAQDLGMAEDVRFLGYRFDVPAIAAATDIAMLTSDSEALGMWLVEAAAAGCPALATNVGGIPDVVRPGCGVTVPAGDPERLAEELLSLAADRERRELMGARAQAHVQRAFPVSRFVADMDQLYWELLDRRRSTSARARSPSRSDHEVVL